MKKTFILLILALSFFSIQLAIAKPATKESVMTLMKKSGAGNTGNMMVEQMIPALKSMMPDAPESFWTDMKAEMNVNNVIDLIVPVYQKHLTEKDVQSINAFYDTKAGKKLIEAQPLIMQESILIGQQWGQEIARNIIEKYKARLQAQAQTIDNNSTKDTEKNIKANK